MCILTASLPIKTETDDQPTDCLHMGVGDCLSQGTVGPSYTVIDVNAKLLTGWGPMLASRCEPSPRDSTTFGLRLRPARYAVAASVTHLQ